MDLREFLLNRTVSHFSLCFIRKLSAIAKGRTEDINPAAALLLLCFSHFSLIKQDAKQLMEKSCLWLWWGGGGGGVVHNGGGGMAAGGYNRKRNDHILNSKDEAGTQNTGNRVRV